MTFACHMPHVSVCPVGEPAAVFVCLAKNKGNGKENGANEREDTRGGQIGTSREKGVEAAERGNRE